MTKDTAKRIFSIESIVPVVIIIFTAGVTWNSIANDKIIIEKRVTKVELEQQNIKNAVKGIDINMAVIQTDQRHITETQRDIKEELKEQNADVKHILELLKAR